MTPAPTLAHAPRHWAEQAPDKTALTFLRDDGQETTLSYRALHDRVARIAAYLRGALAPGERAMLLCPPGLDFVVGFLGCLAAGIIAVPCNLPKPRQLAWRRLAAIAADADAAIVLTVSDASRVFARWFEAEPALAGLRLVDLDGAAMACPAQDRAVTPGEVAFLQYTSGSTGTPKGVIVTHANLTHNETLIRDAFGHDHDTVIVSWLPLFHDLGLIGNVLQAVFLGATCHLMAPSSFMQHPMRWLHAIARTKAATAMAPNFAYERCVETVTEADLALLDLSRWRVALNGAEPIRASTLRRFERRFATCGFRAAASFPAYGLAEATLIVTTADLDQGATIGCSDPTALRAGRWTTPLPDMAGADQVASGRVRGEMALAIVDPETRTPMPDGMTGEAWVRGESVAAGYWRRPAETARTFQATTATGEGPFLRTGDLGLIRDGQLFVVGRRKELVIVRGQNLYPQDVEHVVQQACPMLRADCGAAFSVQMDDEESLVLVQEVKRTALRALDGVTVARLARRAVSDAFDIELRGLVLIRPASLAKTSSGKIQRVLARTLFVDGALEEVYRDVRPEGRAPADLAAAPVPIDGAFSQDLDLTIDWVTGRTATYLRIAAAAVEPDAILADYGLDSSSAVALAADIAAATGTENDPGLIWTYPTVEALARFIHAEARPARDPVGA